MQRNPQSLDFAAPSVTCCSDFWLLALAADIPKIAAFPHDILNMGKHCNLLTVRDSGGRFLIGNSLFTISIWCFGRL